MRKQAAEIGLAIIGGGRVGLFRGEVANRHPSVGWIGLAEKNPKDGEWVDIELTGFKQTAMGEMKCFRLDVTRGSRKRQSVPDVPPPDDGDVPPEDEDAF